MDSNGYWPNHNTHYLIFFGVARLLCSVSALCENAFGCKNCSRLKPLPTHATAQ